MKQTIFKKHLLNDCFRLRQKKTLFSNQIKAAARYCFEVLEYLQKIKIVKNYFFLNHSVAIWLKYGWNVFFNNNYASERNIKPLCLCFLTERFPGRIPKNSCLFNMTSDICFHYRKISIISKEMKCKNKNLKQAPRSILQ